MDYFAGTILAVIVIGSVCGIIKVIAQHLDAMEERENRNQ